MTITRVQALVIALGLALVGIGVARSGATWKPAGGSPGPGAPQTFAEGYLLRDGRLTGELRPGAQGVFADPDTAASPL